MDDNDGSGSFCMFFDKVIDVTSLNSHGLSSGCHRDSTLFLATTADGLGGAAAAVGCEPLRFFKFKDATRNVTGTWRVFSISRFGMIMMVTWWLDDMLMIIAKNGFQFILIEHEIELDKQFILTTQTSDHVHYRTGLRRPSFKQYTFQKGYSNASVFQSRKHTTFHLELQVILEWQVLLSACCLWHTS